MSDDVKSATAGTTSRCLVCDLRESFDSLLTWTRAGRNRIARMVDELPATPPPLCELCDEFVHRNTGDDRDVQLVIRHGYE